MKSFSPSASRALSTAVLAVIHSRAGTYSMFSPPVKVRIYQGLTYIRSFCPTNGPLYAYSYSVDGNGNPSFAFAGKSDMVFAGETVPTVTSLNGRIGTGIVRTLPSRMLPCSWLTRADNTRYGWQISTRVSCPSTPSHKEESLCRTRLSHRADSPNFNGQDLATRESTLRGRTKSLASLLRGLPLYPRPRAPLRHRCCPLPRHVPLQVRSSAFLFLCLHVHWMPFIPFRRSSYTS